MRLVIVHNHFRPGGVRRVIELATPHLLRHVPDVQELVMVSGEPPPERWRDNFVRHAAPVPVKWEVEPAASYISQQTASRESIAQNLEKFFVETLTDGDLIWAHNQGLARNLLLTQALVSAAGRGCTLVFHHHDWWFDNRWHRWPEMLRCGFSTPADVAPVIFAQGANIRHLTINSEDAAIFEQVLPGTAIWTPNPVDRGASPSAKELRDASHWLKIQLGKDVPAWIMPVRLLRRKNLAEGILLTRWLRPEGCLVTTAGTSSPEEECYAARLEHAVRHHGWNVKLSLLNGAGDRGPGVAALMGASEAVLLTSLQEGFGLPYVEATSAGRPLIARRLANIRPDLQEFGFVFPHDYEDLLVAPSLFNWPEETRRQSLLLDSFRQRLPHDFANQLPGMILPENESPVAFSRLTLTAQLEILSAPASETFRVCSPLNPELAAWRELAEDGRLSAAEWPAEADQWLSGGAYGRRFADAISRPAATHPGSGSQKLQEQFIRQKLKNVYPLMMAENT